MVVKERLEREVPEDENDRMLGGPAGVHIVAEESQALPLGHDPPDSLLQGHDRVSCGVVHLVAVRSGIEKQSQVLAIGC